MSDPMFGERYFATRERLAAVIRGILQLAEETHTDLGESLATVDPSKGLREPFLFVVCGEINAGKSSFINSLFNHDLCRVSNLPETHKVTYYQHGLAHREVPMTPVLEERFRPAGFLRDFHVIDTPGTNTKSDEHQQITLRFMPNAEFIAVVFPVTNPWEAATWNFISKLPAEALERMVLIVQKTDLREPQDLKVILGHMSDLAMKRLSRVPPIFAVSAQRVREARKTGPSARRELQTSGFPELEHHLSKQVCESRIRRRGLENWRAQSAAALRSIENRIEDQSRDLNIQGRFLDTIEREIDDMRERFVVRLPIHLNGVAEVFETEAVWVSRKLRRRLGIVLSFIRIFTGDRTGPAMEAIFIERLEATVEEVARKDGSEVVEFCRSHWHPLGERVTAATGVNLGSKEALEEMLESACTRFVKRLGTAARRGIGNLKVRNQLEKDLRHRNLALKSFTVMTLLLTTGGATCGALQVPWAALVLCSLAAVFLLGGIIVAMLTHRSITADFRQRLLDTCGGFASTLQSDYEEALRVFFQDYATSLGAVRSHLAREKSAVEPRLRRWQELFLTLKAIEQDL